MSRYHLLVALSVNILLYSTKMNPPKITHFNTHCYFIFSLKQTFPEEYPLQLRHLMLPQNLERTLNKRFAK